MAWKPFSFGTIELLTFDEKVSSGSGLVYSTSPSTAIDEDGEKYFVKGPEPEVVFAELAGCVLANAVGLTVPCAKVCSIAGHMLAGTRSISNIRLIEPFLRRPDRTTNHSEVFEAIIVDVWLANTDRNMGSIVGSLADDGKVEFVFIDFEKSAALRPSPIINSTMVQARSLWPSDELGALVRDSKPLLTPMRTLRSIAQMDENACNLLIQPVSDALGGIAWATDCVAAVARRARKIHELAEEVWTC